MEMKKVILYVVLPASLIFGPLIAISSPSVGCYQKQIDKNPNSESSKKWQIRLADLCLKTMRPDMAAEMYGKFAARYVDDPRRPDALWYQAIAYQRNEQKAEAIATLVKLFKEHNGHHRRQDADDKLVKEYQYFAHRAGG